MSDVVKICTKRFCSRCGKGGSDAICEICARRELAKKREQLTAAGNTLVDLEQQLADKERERERTQTRATHWYHEYKRAQKALTKLSKKA